jgi:hypothetical protein
MTRDPDILARKHDLLFAELAKHGQITRATTAAGLDRSTAYKTRDTDPEFGERWAKALDAYADSLEAAAHQRAVEGTDKGVYHQGVLMATEKQYSDSLLALLLKAKRKEYRDNSKVELSGPEGGPLQVEQSPTEIARTIAFALALGLRNKEKQAEDGLDLA